MTYQIEWQNKHGSFTCDAEELVWWLIEQIRIKLRAAQAAAPAGDNQAPPPLESGMAAPPPEVTITINLANHLTEFAARYQLNPSRVYRLVFPQCNNDAVLLGGVMHPAKNQPVNPLSPYTFYAGTYSVLANHLEGLLASVPVAAGQATYVLFRDMIKTLKGKPPTTLQTLPDHSQAMSAIGVIAGSEGARCIGMLAAAVMVLNLLKHDITTVDVMFRQGGWPAVGQGTEELLRSIDSKSYARAHRIPYNNLTAPERLFGNCRGINSV